MKKNLLPFLLALLFLSVGCSSDDNIIPDIEQPIEEPQVEATAEDYPAQHFMWQAMNLFYFWQGDVPNLSDSKFTGPTDLPMLSF